MTAIREADGLKWIDRGPDTDDHLAFTGHEMELAPYLYGLADADSLYVNVGAHVGLWALRMAYRAKRVYAIEANPLTFDTLHQNVCLNGLQKRVVPLNEAAWDEDDEILTFIDAQGKESGGSTRLEAAADFSQESRQGIFTRKLDTIFAPVVRFGGERIGLIQLDVEGAEAKVLAGAEKILRKHRPTLLIELHEGHPGTDPDLRQQVYSILEAHGYSYFSVRVAGTEEHLIATPEEMLDEPESISLTD